MGPDTVSTISDTFGDLLKDASDPTVVVIGVSDRKTQEIVDAIRDKGTQCAVVVVDSLGHLQSLKPDHPVMEIEVPYENMPMEPPPFKEKPPKYRCDGKMKRR